MQIHGRLRYRRLGLYKDQAITSVYPGADLASLVISNKGSEMRLPKRQMLSVLKE